MLTEDKIDYLLQVRDSKPPLREDTIRIMLRALKWDSDEIERGIEFVKRPVVDQSKIPHSQMPVVEDQNDQPSVEKPVVIKQNPFPLGSPFKQNLEIRKEVKSRQHLFAGAIFGIIILVSALVAYSLLK